MKKLVLAFSLVLVLAATVCAVKFGSWFGNYYSPEFSGTLMQNWDAQEDFTVNGSDLDLTAGALGGGNSGIGNGVNRVNYYCQGLQNLAATSVDIYYESESKAGVYYQVHLTEGGTAYPLPRITKIKGTGTGTTAAKIKLLYRDASLINGAGKTAQQ
jgi:hypothetical protein